MGLPAVPPLSKIEACADSKDKVSSHQDGERHRDYVLISCLPHYILGSPESQWRLLAPEFSLLVQSTLHILLQLATSSPVWGQYMAQLSELVRSPGCEKGPDSLHEIAKPTQVKFAQWIQLDLKGESDQESLRKIRADHRHIYQDAHGS